MADVDDDNAAALNQNEAPLADGPNMALESREETEARHRKELKALDGEKRAAVKKAKATGGKGKKAKDLLQR